MKPFEVQGYLLISFLFLSQFTYRFFSIIVYNKDRKTQAHLLRESDRLIRALPCKKNNRERLPITRLLGNS